MKKLVKIMFAMAILTIALLSVMGCSKPTQKAPKKELTFEEKIAKVYGNANIGPQEVTKVSELAILTSVSASLKTKGPITITPATLNGEDITLITLGGTEFKDGQATRIEESALAAQGKANDYILAVVNLFKEGYVPRNKPIIVTGISLGGMIAQQVLGVDYIMKRYDIRAIITFGSPFTMPYDRKGVKVVRFQDVHDIVPPSGEIYVDKDKMNALNELERYVETSKYTNPIETHALSYVEDKVWDKYDFLGDKAGTNTLVLQSSLTFYDAPIVSQ